MVYAGGADDETTALGSVAAYLESTFTGGDTGISSSSATRLAFVESLRPGRARVIDTDVQVV